MHKMEDYLLTINKNKKWRKLTISDILDNGAYPIKHDFKIRKCERVKRYRMQKEYGAKKFIKP